MNLPYGLLPFSVLQVPVQPVLHLHLHMDHQGKNNRPSLDHLLEKLP